MANPSFHSIPLFTAAGRDTAGSGEVRSYLERMPGVDGARLQPHGRGPRRIEAEGLVTADGISAAAALAAVKQAVRDRQQQADGRTVAEYVGTDGTIYGDCVLLSFSAVGPVETSGGASPLAVVRCRAELLQLVS
jgi:uncharacterized protein YoaH (UPF0181 family)